MASREIQETVKKSAQITRENVFKLIFMYLYIKRVGSTLHIFATFDEFGFKIKALN